MLKSELNLPKYYEDTKVLHKGCEENRSYYIPYAPGEIKDSSRVQLLSGDWDFRFYNTPFEVEDFTAPDYRYDKYDTIPVPGCIQNYGYDRHQYTNVRFPFPYDPPYVPAENPTCVYHRTLSITQELHTYKHYLNFEGVDSCFYVYVNQTLVGYSQVSHSTSEFDITPYLKSGNNDLTVVVLKWCDGSYLEDQDKFRMTGIFRDVYLLIRPVNHIQDYFVKTLLEAPYTKAEIRVDFRFTGSEVPITCTLQDRDGNMLVTKIVKNNTLSIELLNPHLWNAEDPYLYNLTITTPNEVIYQKVGIRCIEIKEDIIYINGSKVKFKGVNRHDSDPVTGYTIRKEQALIDLKLMKESNINAIRTSHYPNAPWFTGLCNEYGFYVIGESDLEAHGAVSFYGGGYQTTYGDLTQREIFADAILDRNQRNVIRDKNNPSIIMWSMGNEAGYSKAFEDTGRFIKAYDPTRLLHYEGSVHETGGHINDTSMLDVYSTMYASVPSIEEYLTEKPKPYILCEFVHAMGNGPGDIEDYFDCIYKHDRFVGGFVWEWCDHAIYRGITTDGRKIFHYGGDSGEYPHDDNFCVDGMVSPDRIPHPALAEYKNVIRPVRAALLNAEDGTIELENKLDFTNLSDYVSLRSELLYDGELIETLELGTIHLEPHTKGILTIPYNKSYITDMTKTGSVTLRLVYIQSKDLPFTAKGHELGFDQLFLKESSKPYVSAKDIAVANTVDKPFAVHMEENASKVILTGANYCYQFNKLRGNFDSMIINNHCILDKPLEYNIWRAPIDNDRRIRSAWENAGYHRALTRVYDTQVTQESQGTSIHCRLTITAIQIQHILDIEVTWYIGADGTVSLKLDGKRNTDLPYLPRFGLRFFLPKEYQKVNYLGYGPNESYMDKHRSSWFGRFDEVVDTTYVDYIKPQENSSHYGCNDVTITSDYGQSIYITGANPFSFQATAYTQEELMQKAHNYELQKSDGTILCLDYKMSGVGSSSCGPDLAEKYQLCEEDIHWNLTLQFLKTERLTKK
ncbi:glycoside hydrolase family 42 [Anaerocolumna cellulosilytica]|uniref:beta-galactosidase n=1 Tax=Anaerocolumna cellulosilytica TaxID=433286 RepID=A0A6S6R5K6_9FIRM|nr:glycoside hydrolase family 2 TIM barrel-domain containing protein [Anaerocolumna cellulosilytica]MBB5194700.1 beta-galactosidase [Anaerocolumna cellulosilytica]BCJ94338.1 glycoside hydrolase family 42 [Anaerocolumna cellulosilytica]